MTTPSTSKLPFLLQPVPIYTLVWLRIAVGLLAAFDILGNGIYYHWYCGELDAANFQFSYFGFEWVKPFPEPFLSLYFILGFFVGLAVAVGWRFKYTAPTLALAIAYLFLIEKAHYLNHA
ncbi:MAG: HTTM domain-containing protein, partial [Bacteroidota bacterium]